MTTFDVHELTSIEAVRKLHQRVASDLRFLDLLLEQLQQQQQAPAPEPASARVVTHLRAAA